jgi:hypothetical protein
MTVTAPRETSVRIGYADQVRDVPAGDTVEWDVA